MALSKDSKSHSFATIEDVETTQQKTRQDKTTRFWKRQFLESGDAKVDRTVGGVSIRYDTTSRYTKR